MIVKKDLGRIVLGCLPFGGVVDANDSIRVLSEAWRLGLRNFDVANLYGNGEAPELLRKTFNPNQFTPDYWVSIGLERVHDPNGVFSVQVQKLNKVNVFKMANEMLERLGTDKIAVLNIHGPDPTTYLGETIEALIQLRESGKVSKVSISNFLPIELEQVLDFEEKTGSCFEVFQFHGNLLEQRLINEFKVILEQKNKIIYCFRPLARGLLGREYSRINHNPIGSRSTRGWRLNNYLNSTLLAQLELFQDIAKSFSISQTDLALYWLLNRSNIDGVVIGVRTIEQLYSLIGNQDFEIPNDLIRQFDEFLLTKEFRNISNALPIEYFEK